jgi:hypothetical protein
MTEIPETLAPVDDLGNGDALASWRWLSGTNTQVRLLTAMGDFIVLKPMGLLRRNYVCLLDTYTGTIDRIAESWEAFKELLDTSELPLTWFKADLVAQLRARGLMLSQGQCYSPIHPPILGGSYEVDNFEAVPWRVHVGIMGQIHEQVKDLPPGTPITGIDVNTE